MRDLRSIYRALEFIETRLTEDVSAAEMAETSGYSLFYFIRAFNQAVCHSPYNYLIRRRLSEAAKDLVQNNRRLIDIAVDYRFGCPETFTRAFKRMFGILPSQMRENGSLPYRMLLPHLSLTYLDHINSPDFHKPELVEYNNSRWSRRMTSVGNLQTGPRNVEACAEAVPEQLLCFASQRNGEKSTIFHYLSDEPSSFNLTETLLEHNSSSITSGSTLLEGTYIWLQQAGSIITLPMTLAHLYHTWLPKTGLPPAARLEMFIHTSIDGSDQVDPIFHVLLPVSSSFILDKIHTVPEEVNLQLSLLPGNGADPGTGGDR